MKKNILNYKIKTKILIYSIEILKYLLNLKYLSIIFSHFNLRGDIRKWTACKLILVWYQYIW